MKYLLSLGSNLGNRLQNLTTACAELEHSGAVVLRKSAIYETSPWGFEAQNWFYNMAMVVEVDSPPEIFMQQILQIEKQLGRDRFNDGKYHSRVVDIDILLADSAQLNTEAVTVPHPRMHLRKFVLVPAVEIAADWMHPVLQKSLNDVLQTCEDKEEIRRI